MLPSDTKWLTTSMLALLCHLYFLLTLMDVKRKKNWININQSEKCHINPPPFLHKQL